MEPAQNTSRIEKVGQHSLPIKGNELTFVLTPTHDVFVSLPDLCIALSIDVRAQIRRIQRTPSLSTGLQVLPIITRGGRQKINCLESSFVELWLSGVRVNKLQTTIDEARDEIQLAIQSFLLTVGRNEHSSEESENDNSQQLLPTIVPIDEQELREMFAHLPDVEIAEHLMVTSYPEDRALREATLAQKHLWIEGSGTTAWHFVASNKLQVYLGDPDAPLEISDAFERIRSLGESTALTARIILGLWTIRRADERFAKNGSIAIRADEILEWRGVQKHIHRAYSGASRLTTDGYQSKHKRQVHQDLKLLQQCYLRGHYAMRIRGRIHHFLVDGPYLRMSVVKEQTLWGEDPIGYLISPGDWINTYEEEDIHFFAEVDRKVFQLDPQKQQHELRLALYLTERWRQQAKNRVYDEPISMRDLLASSMISPDKANLTNRFVPRIEEALTTLFEKGILGSRALRRTDIDKTKPHWGKDWLNAQWVLSPPHHLMRLNYRENDLQLEGPDAL